MVSALALATLFALSHHLLYWRLHNQQVPGDKFYQEVNTTAGTAFAFLVRMCLAAAVSTVYAQLLWQSLLRQRLSVATIDSLSSLLYSAFELLNFKAIRQFPMIGSVGVDLLSHHNTNCLPAWHFVRTDHELPDYKLDPCASSGLGSFFVHLVHYI